MGKKKDLTVVKRSEIATLMRDGLYSMREIARKCDVSENPVRNVKGYVQNGTLKSNRCLKS